MTTKGSQAEVQIHFGEVRLEIGNLLKLTRRFIELIFPGCDQAQPVVAVGHHLHVHPLEPGRILRPAQPAPLQKALSQHLLKELLGAIEVARLKSALCRPVKAFEVRLRRTRTRPAADQATQNQEREPFDKGFGDSSGF